MGYATDVSDYDSSNDGDASDSDRVVDNVIGVALASGEHDVDNDFVDSGNGSISGTVKEDRGRPLAGVLLTLTTPTGTVVATTASDSDGAHMFKSVDPGNYFVTESNPLEYPSNIKDQDSTDDGDSGEQDSTVDNSISVALGKSENDTGNDFVDSDNA